MDVSRDHGIFNDHRIETIVTFFTNNIRDFNTTVKSFISSIKHVSRIQDGGCKMAPETGLALIRIKNGTEGSKNF